MIISDSQSLPVSTSRTSLSVLCAQSQHLPQFPLRLPTPFWWLLSKSTLGAFFHSWSSLSGLGDSLVSTQHLKDHHDRGANPKCSCIWTSSSYGPCTGEGGGGPPLAVHTTFVPIEMAWPHLSPNLHELPLLERGNQIRPAPRSRPHAALASGLLAPSPGRGAKPQR